LQLGILLVGLALHTALEIVLEVVELLHKTSALIFVQGSFYVLSEKVSCVLDVNLLYLILFLDVLDNIVNSLVLVKFIELLHGTLSLI
jgi:hypothetical protein